MNWVNFIFSVRINKINCKRLKPLSLQLRYNYRYFRYKNKSKLRKPRAVIFACVAILGLSINIPSNLFFSWKNKKHRQTYLSRMDRKCWICSSSLVKRDNPSKKRSTYPSKTTLALIKAWTSTDCIYFYSIDRDCE